MGNIEAKIRIKGKQFEILVDLDSAVKLKKTGQGSALNILAVNTVFIDIKKGMHAGAEDLKAAFGTDDLETVVAHIIKNGELHLPLEYRREETEAKRKQVVDFLARNCIDPRTGTPHTPTRIETALHESHINLDNRPIQEQIPLVIKELQKILPLRIETKKLRIRISANYIGSAYSMIKEFKEKEEWLDDGSLMCVINLPAGMQLEFYDKLNKATHGSVLTEEVK
ncbi:MAG: ribosome assembly factor SBDS [archaeon]